MPLDNFLPGIGSVVDFGFDQLSGAINQKRALKNWRRVNEYNHPKAQMQRLVEAGLNPHAILGKAGSIGQAGPVGQVNTPSTSRYQDARIKSAQTDLVQTNADLARQKLAQAKIATEAQSAVHEIMKAHPDRVISVTSPDGGTIEIAQPSEMDRYQTQAMARHQMVMDDAQIRQIDRIIKGEISMEQAFENLTRTRQMNATERQRTQQILNNNRLWEAVDEMTEGSTNPEVMSVFFKMLLKSVFK